MGAIDFVGSNCKRNNSNGINAFVNPSISDQTYRFKSQSKRKWAYNLWDWYASFEINCSVVHLWGFLTKFSFTCYAIGQSKDADLTSGFTVWKIRCSQYFFFFQILITLCSFLHATTQYKLFQCFKKRHQIANSSNNWWTKTKRRNNSLRWKRK